MDATLDLKSRRWNCEVEEVRYLLEREEYDAVNVKNSRKNSRAALAYARAIDRIQGHDGLGSQEYNRLVEDFQTYKKLYHEDIKVRKSGELLRVLVHGLRRFSSLKTVILHDDYSMLTTLPQESSVPIEGELVRSGPPFARSWPSRWTREWIALYFYDKRPEHIEYDFATIIQGLLSSGIHIQELFVHRSFHGSGIPTHCFDPMPICGPSISPSQTQDVFSGLKSLRLETTQHHGWESECEKCMRAVKGLSSSLVQIVTLQELYLSFDRREVKFEDVFGRSNHNWPYLTHLEIFRVECQKEGLLRFLKAHPLKALCMGDIRLIDSNWVTAFTAMRSCLPHIEEFLVIDWPFDSEGGLKFFSGENNLLIHAIQISNEVRGSEFFGNRNCTSVVLIQTAIRLN